MQIQEGKKEERVEAVEKRGDGEINWRNVRGHAAERQEEASWARRETRKRLDRHVGSKPR